MTTTDRMHPVSTLTADERERARQAYAETPTLLDGPILAALGKIEHCEDIARQIIATVRGGRP